MAWSWLQSVENTITKGTSNFSTGATFTTANVSAGTKLIALCCYDSTATATGMTVKDGAGNSFLLIANTTFASRTQTLLYALDTPVGDVGTKPTITFAGTNTGTNVSSILVMEVSGLAVGATLGAQVDGTPGVATASGTTSISPTYSSTDINEFLLCCYGDDGGPITWTKPTGTTSDTASVNTNGTADIAMAYKNSANGAETSTWARSGTGVQGGAITCAFLLAAAPAATDTPQGVVLAPAFRYLTQRGPSFVPTVTLGDQSFTDYIDAFAAGTTAAVTVAAPSGLIAVTLPGATAAVAVAAPSGLVSVSINGPTATVAIAAPSGTVSVTLPGATGTVAVAAPAGTVSASILGPTATVAVAAPSGLIDVTLPGQTAQVAVVAPTGAVLLGGDSPAVPVVAAAFRHATVPGPSFVPTVTLGDQTFTNYVDAFAVGLTATVAIAAPVGSLNIGSNVSITGPTAGVTIAAPAGLIAVTLPGVTATVAAAAPTGTISVTIPGPTATVAIAAATGTVSVTLPGATAAVTVAAPAGKVSVSINGPTATVAVAAPSGVIAVTLPGTTALVAVAAPAGSVSTGANVSFSGVTATVAVAAPAGKVAVDITGPTAHVAIAAVAGVIAVTLLGSTAQVTVTAPAGSLGGIPVYLTAVSAAYATLTGSADPTATLTTSTTRTGGPS